MVEKKHTGKAKTTASNQIHTMITLVTVAERRGFRGWMMAMYLYNTNR